jgi:hypothetical protein
VEARGWFIPEPPKPRMPFLVRLGLIALIVIAVVLASRTGEGVPATTPSPAATIPARVPAPDAS